MIFTVRAACGSFIGHGRENNEDNFLFNGKHLPVPNSGTQIPLEWRGNTAQPQLLAVFDGMGGECKGEEAALLASRCFAEVSKQQADTALTGRELLQCACQRANAAVNDYRKSQLLTSIGTTVAALWLCQDQVVSCNLGDSRIFRVRDRKMFQVSEDHTDAKILAAMGIAKKPVLLQYIGVPERDMVLEPYITRGQLQPGDVYILCSDGVTDVLSPQELYTLTERCEPEIAVKQILAQVDSRNGADNTTVIVVKIVGQEV